MSATAPVGDIDVVILGAGINGAGLFRDLCAQGVDCLITDKADFGSGTSAAPSRLIHGGLKYLETGEFGLVAQSTLERNLLLKNAPHTVQPLPTVIPIFSWGKGIGAALRTLFGSTTAPRSRGALLIKAGLAIYDHYGSRDRVMPRHRMFGRKRSLKDLPALTPEIVATGTYFDAKVTHPERLVLELVQDGLEANAGSTARNYTELVSAVEGVLTFRTEKGETIAVRPKLVVNAAGPWIDKVNAQLGLETRMIGGTKGSHILLDHPELVRALKGRMIYFEADDGRICLVYEYAGRALVGSTDVKADNPDTVRCEPEEIDYFLASLRSLLPALSFSREQIVYAYSGIRPLPASDASVPGLISRDHSAPVREPEAGRPFPVIALVGGKWTTFRGFAEEVADTVLGWLRRERKASTRNMPIGGGKGFPTETRAREKWLASAEVESCVSRERMEQLLSRYGTTALEVAKHGSGRNDDTALPDSADYRLGEIDWIARNEAVLHLADIVMRRTRLATGGSLTIRDLEVVAAVAAQALDWSEARVAEEIGRTAAELRERHGMRL